MEKDIHERGPGAPDGRVPAPGRRTWAFRAAAVAVVLGSCSATGSLMYNCWLHPGEATPQPGAGGSAPSARSRLFHGWPKDRKPDLARVLSGEEHGYLQPCGCSEPQLGGMERRYNFFQEVQVERGWPCVAVDLGDLAQRSGPQALLKYRYAMTCLQRLSYTAVGVGPNEIGLPLLDALAEYSLNNPSPRVVVTNLLDRDTKYPAGMVVPFDVAARPGVPRVGVVAVVAPSIVRERQDKDVGFSDAAKVLPDAIRQLDAQRVDLRVLLLQGSFDEAKQVAKDFPQFHVILCRTLEEEPPGNPEKAGQTLVIGVGHKGRYVGVVGVYRTADAGRPFEFRYQLVPMSPEYKTPPGRDADNPILALLENYSKEVKERNYLAQYPKSPHPIQQETEFREATYVGSEKCRRCHETAYQIWKDSPHARAYESLTRAERPSLRQYDGECVVCHVTGFAYAGGFTDEQRTPYLRDNGCENCHGPGSLHVQHPGNRKLRALMNPFKPKDGETPAERTARMNRLDAACQKCHDTDNDVHWSIDKWTTKKIVHREPRE